MPQNVDIYRIFIASPGGLDEERAKIAEICHQYTENEALSRGVLFRHVGWENVFGGFGTRPQSAINAALAECDFFVLLLHDSWGSDPGGNNEFSSGTEEEWERARTLFEDPEAPMRQLAVFFKAVSVEKMADPGPRLQPVLDFRKRLEQQRELLYRTFDVVDRFADLFRQYLSYWMRDIEHEASMLENLRPATPLEFETTIRALDKSDCSSAGTRALANKGVGTIEALQRDATTTKKDFLISTSSNHKSALGTSGYPSCEPSEPKSAMTLGLGWPESPQKDVATEGDSPILETRTPTAAGDAEAIQRNILLLDTAESLANSGQITEAEISFAQAVKIGGPDASIRFGHFLRRLGRLEQAEESYQRVMDQAPGDRIWKGRAIGSLGIIYRTRGDLGRAEKMHRKALEISKHQGDKEAVAEQYGNLGIVYRNREEFGLAIEMHREALAICEELGFQKISARQYGSLGNVFAAIGSLSEAETMYQKSLEISEGLGSLEDCAAAYGNLGVIYRRRGDLGRAEVMHRKSLAIERALDRPEGIAADYNNLGYVLEARGDYNQARSYYRKAEELDKQAGFKGREITQRNLSRIAEPEQVESPRKDN